MTLRAAALLLGLLAYAPVVAAHDFWLQPADFMIAPEAVVPLTLQVGHGPLRQRSPIPARRITQFRAIDPGGAVVDLQAQLRLGEPAQDGELRLGGKSGAYVLLLQTDDHAQTHLPSLRFNEYLRAEGLTPALERRARLGRLDADGSERYSRCAKSIVQVGAAAGAGSGGQISKAVGLPLEIVPEANPYDPMRSAVLPVRVIYAGRPLAGALVKLTDLGNDALPVETHVTDGGGRARFAMPDAGAWLLNVIWTTPLPASEGVDFETFFSSLSFGVSPRKLSR